MSIGPKCLNLKVLNLKVPVVLTCHTEADLATLLLDFSTTQTPGTYYSSFRFSKAPDIGANLYCCNVDNKGNVSLIFPAWSGISAITVCWSKEKSRPVVYYGDNDNREAWLIDFHKLYCPREGNLQIIFNMVGELVEELLPKLKLGY